MDENQLTWWNEDKIGAWFWVHDSSFKLVLEKPNASGLDLLGCKRKFVWDFSIILFMSYQITCFYFKLYQTRISRMDRLFHFMFLFMNFVAILCSYFILWICLIFNSFPISSKDRGVSPLSPKYNFTISFIIS